MPISPMYKFLSTGAASINGQPEEPEGTELDLGGLDIGDGVDPGAYTAAPVPPEAPVVPTEDPRAKERLMLAAIAQTAGQFARRPVQSTVMPFAEQINELQRQKLERDAKLAMSEKAYGVKMAQYKDQNTIRNEQLGINRKKAQAYLKYMKQKTGAPTGHVDDLDIPESTRSKEEVKATEQLLGRQLPPGTSGRVAQTLRSSYKAPPTASEQTTLDRTAKKGTYDMMKGISDAYSGDKVTTNTKTMLESYHKLEGVLSGKPSGAADMAALYKFINMLDPGSAVREGELGLAREMQGVLNTWGQMPEKVLSGQMLSPEFRKGIEASIRSLMAGQWRIQQKIDAKYKAQATHYEVPPEEVGFVTDWGYDFPMEKAGSSSESTQYSGNTTAKPRGAPPAQQAVNQNQSAAQSTPVPKKRITADDFLGGG